MVAVDEMMIFVYAADARVYGKSGQPRENETMTNRKDVSPSSRLCCGACSLFF